MAAIGDKIPTARKGGPRKARRGSLDAVTLDTGADSKNHTTVQANATIRRTC